MNNLVVIPARGGSKGIPGKNIKIFNGKPLILHAVDAAKKIFNDNEIIVSTDDIKIKKVVEDSGLIVPFLRPSYLATDTSGTYEVLLHAVDYFEKAYGKIETLVLLQPTSPFRNSKHIREALELYNSYNNIDMVVSVSETKSNPYYVLFEENNEGFLNHSKKGNFIRRQDCPKVWEYNGAIYIINIKSLKKSNLSSFKRVVKYVMDEKSSLDLDSQMDMLFAEYLLKLENDI